MLEIRRSKKPKHKGVIFLIDGKTNTFIGKVYDVPNKEIIAEAWITAYNKMCDNIRHERDLSDFSDEAFEDEIRECFEDEDNE